MPIRLAIVPGFKAVFHSRSYPGEFSHGTEDPTIAIGQDLLETEGCERVIAHEIYHSRLPRGAERYESPEEVLREEIEADIWGEMVSGVKTPVNRIKYLIGYAVKWGIPKESFLTMVNTASINLEYKNRRLINHIHTYWGG